MAFLFHARMYPTAAASEVAYLALGRTVGSTIGIGACILIHGELHGADVVILGVDEHEEHERIRSGHWIGGTPIPVPPDVARALVRRFERTRHEAADGRHEGAYGAAGAPLLDDGGVGPSS